MIFITVQEVIDEHSKIIYKYGGLDGIRDIGLLYLAIEMPKAALFKKYLHPTVFDNDIHVEFTEKQSLALEELVVYTAEGKTTKEQKLLFLERFTKAEGKVLAEKT